MYALGDVKDGNLRSSCDHVHDQICSRCEDLRNVLDGIEKFFSDQTCLSKDDLEDFKYTYKVSLEDINAWKAHQLRSVRQDQARTDCSRKLNEASVLITQDWAMKFLPRKYRESQSDWFGKRGISWHISVVARKKCGQLESQSFVHIVKNCSQDTPVVMRLLEHSLRMLKVEHPEITTAYLRQDNAGCYHSALLIATCFLLAARTGISVSRVDFSDPQGGKGACDRKAATIKAHIRRYINEGHDVQNAQDLQQAMLSNGGINGVRVILVDATEGCCQVPQAKLPGISLLNNFAYSEKSVTVWKAYEVGKGNVLDRSVIEGKLSVRTCYVYFNKLINFVFQTVPDFLQSCMVQSNVSGGDFVSSSREKSKKVEEKDSASEELQDDSALAAVELFSCPKEGCVKMYQRYSSLERHLSFGQCKMMPEKETLFDSARRRYHTLLTEGTVLSHQYCKPQSQCLQTAT